MFLVVLVWHVPHKQRRVTSPRLLCLPLHALHGLLPLHPARHLQGLHPERENVLLYIYIYRIVSSELLPVMFCLWFPRACSPVRDKSGNRRQEPTNFASIQDLRNFVLQNIKTIRGC